jgi:formate dehydrogenase iron-sulfur subunit
MSELTAERPKFLTGPTAIILILAIVGGTLALYRFFTGIGTVSNLNDAYPWGFWIGFDILTGVALAAGGFIMAAMVYVWQDKKLYPAARPALVTAFLGYCILVIALLVDLGRYYRVWHVLWPPFWQKDSVMFQVGWCDVTYLIVLFLEVVPIVLKKFGWTILERLYSAFMPPVVIVLLSLFMLAMAATWKWAALVAALLILFQFLKLIGVIPRHRGIVPVILVMIGVIVCILHQMALGWLYVIIPHKLDPLSWSMGLPLLFLLSAFMVGPAMVIFEGALSARVFRRPMEMDILQRLGKALPVLIGLYLVVRVGDLVRQNVIWQAFDPTPQALMLWLEIVIGCLIPITLLATPEVRRSKAGLFLGALCVMIGVLINRFAVSMVGIQPHGWQTYFPSLREVMISVGVVCMGLLVFRYAALYFPVFVQHDEQPA